MFFIFEISRICEVRGFPHVICLSYLGLLATTKLKREDFYNLVGDLIKAGEIGIGDLIRGNKVVTE